MRATELLSAASAVGGSYGAYDLFDVEGLAPALSDALQDAVLFGLELGEPLAELSWAPSLLSHLPTTVGSVTDLPSSGTCI